MEGSTTSATPPQKTRQHKKALSGQIGLRCRSPLRHKKLSTAKTARYSRPKRAPQLGRASREDLLISRETGWAGTPKYSKGNEILPIPELVEKLTPRILSLVVSDLKMKKLEGLNKDTFEELLRKAGNPCQYFCRKSFATWDTLLPTEEQAAKAAANNIVTKHFRLQPEYKGTRRLCVTVSNVPAVITGEVLAAYLSVFGQVEEFNLLRSPVGTAYGEYAFRLCLTRDGFKAILETLISGVWW